MNAGSMGCSGLIMAKVTAQLEMWSKTDQRAGIGAAKTFDRCMVLAKRLANPAKQRSFSIRDTALQEDRAAAHDAC